MIKVDNIFYKYDGKNFIENLSFEIEKGDFVSIIGKNGSGKSTLVRLLTGIKKPSKGTILVDDIDTKSKKDFIALRNKISVVFQNPENQLIFETVSEELKFILKNLKKPIDTFDESIDSALKLVGMEDFRDAEINSLSLGQKQKIVIASSLVQGTDYLVLDEPTAMLDPESKQMILKILKDLNKQGKTIVLITHDLAEVLYSDKILILENGNIVSEISTIDFLNDNSIMEKLNFDKNYFFKLLVEIKKKNPALKLDTTNIDDIIKKVLEEID